MSVVVVATDGLIITLTIRDLANPRRPNLVFVLNARMRYGTNPE
jgi:hypothetical protein